METYPVALALFGAIVLMTAWLPMVLKELPLSLPMACIAVGAGAFLAPGVPGLPPDPREHLALVERLTEIVLIVALMGAGLRLDRPLGLAAGGNAVRLLVLAMPVTILALAALAWGLLGFSLAAAVLLGAALAPTDPVLAGDVQVGAPGEGEEDEVRYTLTAEAGFNDGLAFPFVNLALTMAAGGAAWVADWALVDVAWKLVCGIAVGWAAGQALGWLTFRLPNRARLSHTGDGFVALGVTAIAYGAAEAAHGYGFLAVFVAAIGFRAVERHHRYHERLHDFIEQLERLLMMALLVLFGGAITAGGLLDALDGPVMLFAAVAIFAVRPAIGFVCLAGRRLPTGERAAIAFFGIRGLGSAYYIAYALALWPAPMPEADRLWAAAALIVLVSVVLHGITVTPVMRALDARAQRR